MRDSLSSKWTTLDQQPSDSLKKYILCIVAKIWGENRSQEKQYVEYVLFWLKLAYMQDPIEILLLLIDADTNNYNSNKTHFIYNKKSISGLLIWPSKAFSGHLILQPLRIQRYLVKKILVYVVTIHIWNSNILWIESGARAITLGQGDGRSIGVSH